MEEIEIFMRLAFMGLGLIMAALTLASWHRAGEPKLLLASAGFGILAALGVMLCIGIFFEDFEAFNSTLVIVAMNFLALVLLYLSVLKR